MHKQDHHALLQALQARFEQHRQRHAGLDWADVRQRLDAQPAALRTLQAMQSSGGEPDVVHGPEFEGVSLCDCSAESPAGRRSICYDAEARAARKEHPPQGSAQEWAAEMGAQLLTPAQYLALQQFGEFDTKTSSWLHTPAEVRTLGGALFGDRRYARVFIYHNGAQSYYAARGFRVCIQI